MASPPRAAVVAFAAVVLGFGVYCATHSVDFPVYHRVARQVLSGNYELYPAAVYTGVGTIPSHDFRYAPVTAFLFVPFGLLPMRVAAFVFYLLKVAALLYMGGVVGRYVGGFRTAPRALMAISVLLAGGYVIEEFHYGNFHLLCIALMVFAFDSAASGRVVKPALALGIAIATKLTPILLLFYFAWRRRFRLCLATIVVLVLLAFLPALVVGYQANNHLLGGFATYALEKIDENDNYALRGMLVRLGLSLSVATVLWLGAVIAGGIAVAVALRPEPVGPAPRFLELCVVLTAMLVASPHAQRRYFIALYVPILALLCLMKTRPRLPEENLIRVALTLTAAFGTILPLLFAGPTLAHLYQAYSPHVVGGLAVLAALVAAAARVKENERAVSADSP
jgi:hypothetical protein